MSSFKYRPLSTPRSVRMLSIIEACNDGSPALVCHLTEVSLDCAFLNYHALSYTWGDSSQTSRLLVNGKWLSVRRNLEDCLRHLRMDLHCCDRLCVCRREGYSPVPLDQRFTFPALLWVDAICINQDDLEERARQVTLMREVYSKASSVIVWLGRATEHTVPAFRMLFGLANLYDSTLDVVQGYIEHVVSTESFKDHWLALGELLQREWWHRVWTIQEVVLASKVQVICGPFAVDWDRIVRATAVFNLCFHFMDRLIEATVLSGQYQYFFAFRNAAWRMKMIRWLRLHIRQNREPRLLEGPPSSANLVYLLGITRDYDATDPRDKIYAILGLLEELGFESPLVPSYHISVDELYTQVAKIIQQESGDLDFLSNVFINPMTRRGALSGLPSWAPNWTVPTDYRSIVYSGRYHKAHGNQNCQTSRNSFPFTVDFEVNCRFMLDKRQIVIKGFLFGHIWEIATRYKDLEPDFKANGNKRYGYRICWKSPGPTDQFKHHDYWLTRLGFQSEFPSPGFTAPQLDDGKTRRLDQRCFKTKPHSLLGSTDVSIRYGDAVCGLIGNRFPCILRPCGRSWKFIGPCILNDAEFMNCPFMKELSTGRLSLRDFIVE